MKVKFRVNLGSRDAAAFNVDFRSCQCGAEVDLDGAAAASFVDRGFAVPVDVPAPKPPKPKKVTTVPPAVDTKAAAVEVKTTDTPAKDAE